MTLAHPNAARILRRIVTLATLTVLAGCATHTARLQQQTHEAAKYAARARADYTPPGPPGDPWGPYIHEAAGRFDMPDQWVRGVMQQESGGRMYEFGQLITSPVGAMGLMQVMPATYDELRARYSLGDDPYDPHANILAGTGYMRELYDAYGAPAFLAAYNAGPRRLDDYLTRNRPLPDETRHYVAKIGPSLYGARPLRIADAQNLAMNQIPINIPSGPRYPVQRTARYAIAAVERRGKYTTVRYRTQPEALPQPEPPPQYAMAQVAKPAHGGFHLVGRAYADTIPVRSGGPAVGGWGVQVGAFATAALAKSAAEQARAAGLSAGRVVVGEARGPRGTLYRARVVGLSREAATAGCDRAGHRACVIVSANSQS